MPTVSDGEAGPVLGFLLPYTAEENHYELNPALFSPHDNDGSSPSPAAFGHEALSPPMYSPTSPCPREIEEASVGQDSHSLFLLGDNMCSPESPHQSDREVLDRGQSAGLQNPNTGPASPSDTVGSAHATN